MKHVTFLMGAVLVAAAFAGCANDSTAQPPTSTPTDTTPTPTLAPPAGNETDNESHEMPLDCPTPEADNTEAPDVLGYPQLVFTVKEPQGDDECFGFVGPDNATAGWTAITVRDNGMSPHIAPLFFIGNHTLDDVKAAFADENQPEWLVPVGGVGFVTPFSSGTVLVNLEAGNYLMICFFEGHFMQGMYRMLTVTGEAANDTAAPEANGTIELRDFNFTVSELSPGLQIVKVVNNGTQPHEAPLIKLADNTTAEEFLAALENPNATAPPPGTGVGGLNTLAPGASAYAILDLTEGNYALVCFVEDPATHQPHVALGMLGEFSVA